MRKRVVNEMDSPGDRELRRRARLHVVRRAETEAFRRQVAAEELLVGDLPDADDSDNLAEW